MIKNHFAEIDPATGAILVTVLEGGAAIATSENALTLTEYYKGDILPPVFYIPRADIDFSKLVKNEDHSTHCPIKGDASYYSLQTDNGLIENIAWSYEAPLDHVAEIKDHLAFDGKLVTIKKSQFDNPARRK